MCSIYILAFLLKCQEPNLTYHNSALCVYFGHKLSLSIICQSFYGAGNPLSQVQYMFCQSFYDAGNPSDSVYILPILLCMMPRTPPSPEYYLPNIMWFWEPLCLSIYSTNPSMVPGTHLSQYSIQYILPILLWCREPLCPSIYSANTSLVRGTSLTQNIFCQSFYGAGNPSASSINSANPSMVPGTPLSQVYILPIFCGAGNPSDSVRHVTGNDKDFLR